MLYLGQPSEGRAAMIRIEVAYALPDRQQIIALEVEENCTVLDAARRSGIDREFPEIDWASALFGIFSHIVEQPAQQLLRDGDRIEIYRPLLIDPKVVRQQRADNKQRSENKRATLSKPTANN
jgi:putative ubiquitin-RnfH superfamily antitoxin RatB of RatAB toxin-antitoxin module